MKSLFSVKQDAQNYLALEGEEALAKATTRAEQVGQQNQQMTKIAEEARKLGDA